MANEPMPINEFLALLAKTGGLADSQVFGINVIVEICNNLHMKRLDAGLSVREFAGILGVSPSTILRWEGGEFNPPIRKLAEIIYRLDEWEDSNEPNRRK